MLVQVNGSTSGDTLCSCCRTSLHQRGITFEEFGCFQKQSFLCLLGLAVIRSAHSNQRNVSLPFPAGVSGFCFGVKHTPTRHTRSVITQECSFNTARNNFTNTKEGMSGSYSSSGKNNTPWRCLQAHSYSTVSPNMTILWSWYRSYHAILCRISD